MVKIAIIDGTVIGPSIAYYLALPGHAADVAVIEPDPTYGRLDYQRILDGVPLHDELSKA